MLHQKTKDSFMASRVQKFLLFGLICILTGYVVYLFAPDYIHLFVQEDHLVEVLSALSYLVAFALGVWIYKNYRRWRMFTVAVMVLGPLGFFSELSLDRKSTRLNSSHVAISYACFCLKKKYYSE